MRRERPDHTWQPTALVNEVLLRLRRDGTLERATDRAFLLMAASKAMQQLLVDHHAVAFPVKPDREIEKSGKTRYTGQGSSWSGRRTKRALSRKRPRAGPL